MQVPAMQEPHPVLQAIDVHVFALTCEQVSDIGLASVRQCVSSASSEVNHATNNACDDDVGSIAVKEMEVINLVFDELDRIDATQLLETVVVVALDCQVAERVLLENLSEFIRLVLGLPVPQVGHVTSVHLVPIAQIACDMHVFDTLIQCPLEDLVEGLPVELERTCMDIAEFEPPNSLRIPRLARDKERGHLVANRDTVVPLSLLCSPIDHVPLSLQGLDIGLPALQLLEGKPPCLQLLHQLLGIHLNPSFRCCLGCKASKFIISFLGGVVILFNRCNYTHFTPFLHLFNPNILTRDKLPFDSCGLSRDTAKPFPSLDIGVIHLKN